MQRICEGAAEASVKLHEDKDRSSAASLASLALSLLHFAVCSASLVASLPLPSPSQHSPRRSRSSCPAGGLRVFGFRVSGLGFRV
jgi:hypothetical protein